MIDLNRPAPTTEPERPYYFIKKVQEYVKAQPEKLGRPLTANIMQILLSTTPVLSVKMQTYVSTDVWACCMDIRKRIRI